MWKLNFFRDAGTVPEMSGLRKLKQKGCHEFDCQIGIEQALVWLGVLPQNKTKW